MVRSALAPQRQRLCLLTEAKRKTVLPLLQQAGGASICTVTGWQAHRATWLVYLPAPGRPRSREVHQRMPPVREWHDTVQGAAMEGLAAEDSEFLARSDPTVTPLWSSPSHSSAASPHSQASITPSRRSRGAHRAPAEPMGVDRTNLHPRVGGAAPQVRLSRTALATVPGRMEDEPKEVPTAVPRGAPAHARAR